MPLCNRMFVAFLSNISILKSGWNMKKLLSCPALELFHCLPLWKTVLFVSSRAFWLPLWTTVRLHGKKLQNATKKHLWMDPLLVLKVSEFYTAIYRAWGHRNLLNRKSLHIPLHSAGLWLLIIHCLGNTDYGRPEGKKPFSARPKIQY